MTHFPGGVQLSLDDLDATSVEPDASFATLERVDLDGTAWVEHCAGWVSGDKLLFTDLLDTVPFAGHERRMYDGYVKEPRLTAHWRQDDPAVAPPPAFHRIRSLLSERYDVEFDSAGFALYRGGDDSVAWHGDRVGRANPDATVAIVSLGATRRFRLRPKGGGTSRAWDFASGDLLVMGRCQTTWEHCIPKTRQRTGPRISISFRHGPLGQPPLRSSTRGAAGFT